MNDSVLMKIGWTLLAAIAGSITALSFRPYNRMSGWQIALSLFVGASFAFFVGPWVVYLVFGDKNIDVRLMGAIFYVLASGSNILIPLCIEKISSLLGVKKEEIL